jgi:hypothetical protein
METKNKLYIDNIPIANVIIIEVESYPTVIEENIRNNTQIVPFRISNSQIDLPCTRINVNEIDVENDDLDVKEIIGNIIICLGMTAYILFLLWLFKPEILSPKKK